jgi:hypothetical protein
MGAMQYPTWKTDRKGYRCLRTISLLWEPIRAKYRVVMDGCPVCLTNTIMLLCVFCVEYLIVMPWKSYCSSPGCCIGAMSHIESAGVGMHHTGEHLISNSFWNVQIMLLISVNPNFTLYLIINVYYFYFFINVNHYEVENKLILKSNQSNIDDLLQYIDKTNSQLDFFIGTSSTPFWANF